MKKTVTFRINEDVLILINELAKEYETTKVHIVENAIKTYANIKKFKNKDLLKYIGKIDKNDLKKIRKML
jgi:predicted transcriptional regulator